MRLFPDQVYVYTFHATGCPNINPSLGWWTTLPKDSVFNDMNTYCELTRDGNANEEQKSQCCGNNDCTVQNCAKQTKWVLGT